MRYKVTHVVVPDRQAVIQGARALLRPLVSLLLRCGLTWREFAELSRTVFVEVASHEYGLRGRPTNVARVAILTGIGRRDVGRIRAELQVAGPRLPNQTTDATRLLSGWHQDREFLDGSGQPRELMVVDGGASFTALARRYAPDVPASAMLKELLRVGAVVELPAGQLRAVRRFYQPTPFDPQWFLNAGSVYADLGVNINHNLAVVSSGEPTRFLGRATDSSIDAAAVAEFQVFLEQEGQQFLERVDAWLGVHRRTGPPADGRRAVRLGVGLFMIKGDPDKESGNE